ncbi:MAG: TlpA family protein disulfide reductase [Acidimicrobiia bacterium]
MTGGRRAAAAAAGFALVAVLGALALLPAGEEETPPGAAPAFEATDLEGGTVRLSDFRGRPVLVNFWASWCVPCRREFPLLRAVHGEEVAVLGVVFDDTAEAALAFMRDQRATWPALADPGGRIAEDYGVGSRPGLPVTVAVDRAGALVDRHVGELRREDLDRLVEAASR